MKVFARIQEALATRLALLRGGRAPFSGATTKILLFVLILGAAVWFVLRDHGLLEHARLRTTLDSLQDCSVRAQTQIAWYRGRNRRLEVNDPFTLEEEARRLGMARPGEELYRVVLPQDTVRQPESQQP